MRIMMARLVIPVLLAAAVGGLTVPAAAEETAFGPPQVPEGFHILPVVQNLHHPTRLAFGPDGRPGPGAGLAAAAPPVTCQHILNSRPLLLEGGTVMPDDGGGPIESTMARAGQAGPIGAEPAFGLPGLSIEAPGSYFGGRPVGGPSSIFNIGGAPIAVLGGVFSGGLPLGGPVGQVFRSSAPVPNTLFISTLEPSGPIGQDLIGAGGIPLGGVAELGAPITGFREGAEPIGELFLEGARSLGEPTGGLGGLTLGELRLPSLSLGGLSGLSSLNGTMQRD